MACEARRGKEKVPRIGQRPMQIRPPSDAEQSVSDLERELSERDQLASDRDPGGGTRPGGVRSRTELHSDEASRRAHEAGRAGREAEAGRATRHRESAPERLRSGPSCGETRRERPPPSMPGIANNATGRPSRRAKDRLPRARPGGARAGGADPRARQRRTVRGRLKERGQAARDRARAAAERAEVLAELRRAHVDALTGALRRGIGEVALQGEIDRVRLGDGRLVLCHCRRRLAQGPQRRARVMRRATRCCARIVSAIRSTRALLRADRALRRGRVRLRDFGRRHGPERSERFAAIRESDAADRAGEVLSVGLARAATTEDELERPVGPSGHRAARRSPGAFGRGLTFVLDSQHGG